jgi:hypothetical protein
MAFSRVRVLHILLLALIAGVAMVPAGCGPEPGVTKYDVVRTTEAKKGSGYVHEGEYRILGAMYPADEPRWFFKLPGRTDELTKLEADFDKLIASVSLPPNGGAPEFTTPEGWTRGPGRGEYVAATIRTPDGKHEVTITSSAGTVLENLKRWAVMPAQLGGKGFDANDIPTVTKPIAAKGVNGLRADVRGPKNPASKGGPMMMPQGHP